MKQLNDQEAIFKDEYVKSRDVVKSALKAKYAATTAKTKAFMWVSGSKCPENKRHLYIAIHNALQEVEEKTVVDAAFIRSHLAEMMTADIGDIYNETGTFKPMHDWPKIWRQMLQGVDVEELFEGYGKEREHIGQTVKARFIDKMKAIELLGRHVDVKAFEKQVTEIHIHQKLISRLQQGRQRVIDHKPLKVVKGGKK